MYVYNSNNNTNTILRDEDDIAKFIEVKYPNKEWRYTYAHSEITIDGVYPIYVHREECKLNEDNNIIEHFNDITTN